MEAGDGHQVYVVTEELERSVWLRGNPTTVPGNLLEQCRRRLYGALPGMTGAELIVLREALLREALNAKVREVCSELEQPFVVSMTHYTEEPDAEIHATRVAICDHSGTWTKSELSVARPGFPSLPEQVAAIAIRASGKDVVLVDDGIWSGGTTEKIVSLFGEYFAPVKRIVVGVVANRKELEDPEKGRPHVAEMCFGVHEWPKSDGQRVLDWIDERDFYIGPQGFGRTLGLSGLRAPHPRGIAVPYSFPHGVPGGEDGGWASIDMRELKNFSRLVIELSDQLLAGLEELVGRVIRVHDLYTTPYGMHMTPNRSVRECLGEWLAAHPSLQP